MANTNAVLGPRDGNKRLETAPSPEQYEGLVQSVLAQVHGISREDAEDAVQDAWLVLEKKADQLAPGPVGGYLMRSARFKAMHIRDRARKSASLDGLIEISGDGSEFLADRHSASLEDKVELAQLDDDPVATQALAAARSGAAAYIAPRGTGHRAARYSDEQIAMVRKLRSDGLAFVRIEEMTGVSAGYCSMLTRGKARLLASDEGWTEDLALGAIRRFKGRRGRVPRLRDAERNPRMPSPNTAKRLFGSWQNAVRAAGLDPPYGRRRVNSWSEPELILAFCSWRLKKGRWPGRDDLVADPQLPSPATTRRRFGTQSPTKLVQAVLQRLA